MKKALLIILSLVSIAATAQSPARPLAMWQRMHEKVAGENCRRFIDAVEADDWDAIPEILEAWQSGSFLSEPLLRAYILFAIRQGSYSDEILPGNVITHIYAYNKRMEMIEDYTAEYYDRFPDLYGYIYPDSKFDWLTMSLARELKDACERGTPEYFWTDFYSGAHSTVFDLVREGNMPVKQIADGYDSALNEVLPLGEFDFSILAGAWVPVGELSAVGIHPEIGVRGGWKQGKMNYSFSIATKFLDSSRAYNTHPVHSPSAVESAKGFYGFYGGFDIGYDIWRMGRNELQLTGGVGLDMFYAVKGDKGKNMAWAPDLSFGVEYRRYVSMKHYVGISVKYNIVNYPISKAVGYGGDILTVRFTMGLMANPKRNDVLDVLGYDYRNF